MNTQALRAIAIDPDVVDRDYAPTIISAAAKIETDAKVIAALREALEVATIAMERAAEALPLHEQSIGHAWGLLDGNAKAARKILGNEQNVGE